MALLAITLYPLVTTSSLPNKKNETMPGGSTMSNDAFNSASDSQYDIEDSTSATPRGKNRFLALIVAIVLIAGGGYYYVSHHSGSDTKKLQGKVALSEKELRDLVVAKKLTVYWAGPLAGAKYGITVTGTGLAYIRYLPGGVGINDTKTAFRAVGTYTQKNAFAVNQTTGQQTGNALLETGHIARGDGLHGIGKAADRQILRDPR